MVSGWMEIGIALIPCHHFSCFSSLRLFFLTRFHEIILKKDTIITLGNQLLKQHVVFHA